MCRSRISKCFFRISRLVARKQTRCFKCSRKCETSESELSWSKHLRANTRSDYAFWMTYYIWCGYLTIIVTLHSQLWFSWSNWTRTMISHFVIMMTVVKATTAGKTKSKKHPVVFWRRSKVIVRSHLIIHRWVCNSFRLVRSGQNYSQRAIVVPTSRKQVVSKAVADFWALWSRAILLIWQTQSNLVLKRLNHKTSCWTQKSIKVLTDFSGKS